MMTHTVEHTDIFSREVVQHTQAIPDWKGVGSLAAFVAMGRFSLPEDSSYPRTGSAPSGEHRVFRPTIPVMLDPNDLGDDLASARRQPLGHAWALLMNGSRRGPPIGQHGPSGQTVEARSGEPKMTRQSSHRQGNATSKGARVAQVLK
jgi:hypothetical protein